MSETLSVVPEMAPGKARRVSRELTAQQRDRLMATLCLTAGAVGFISFPLLLWGSAAALTAYYGGVAVAGIGTAAAIKTAIAGAVGILATVGLSIAERSDTVRVGSKFVKESRRI